MTNRLCSGKLETLSYALGPTWWQTQQNWDLNFSVIQLGFSVLRSLVSAIRCEANKSKQQTHWLAHSQNVEGLTQHLVAVNAPKQEHVCTTGPYDVKDRRAPKVAWWLTRKRDLRSGNWTSKTRWVEAKISMIQSIQLGFSRSLDSATSNEANKSAMLRAEWTITARRAVLRLAQWNIDIFSQNTASRTQFFRYRPSKQGISW